MKKTIITLTLAIVASMLVLANTPDSMYVHFTSSQGVDSIVVHAIDDVDSIVYYALDVLPETSGTFIDSRDDNSYNWVKIGEQIWMAENLAYLPQVDDNSTFADATDARYGVYDYDGTVVSTAKATPNFTTYGVFYNWHAAIAGGNSSETNPSNVRGVCPAGWHLPSRAEWRDIEVSLSGEHKPSQMADSVNLWIEGPLSTATEFGLSGFVGLPGGYRSSTTGLYHLKGEYAFWWTCSEDPVSAEHVWDVSISYDKNEFDCGLDCVGYTSKSTGRQIRCVKN